MAHGHRKPAIVEGGKGFVEGSLLPPDPLEPFGEVTIRYRGVMVRVPFTGIEPTPRQLITSALESLRNYFDDLPRPKVWNLAPMGSDANKLEFELQALR